MMGTRSFIRAIGLFFWLTSAGADVNYNAVFNVQDSSGSTHSPDVKPKDCTELHQFQKQSGIFTIYPDRAMPKGFNVSCDMDIDGGGWTVIQRRVTDTDFYKTWNEYQTGFGDLAKNFWLGNQKISIITSQGWYELRIDLMATNGDTRFANYEVFSVGDAQSEYTLFVDGYSGNANDSMPTHNGAKFSTKDRDNDNRSGNCAQSYKGGWWYNDCHEANLNGDFGNTEFGQGINWYHWLGHRVSLAKADMKIRRKI
ncbi:ryncolin-1-like [Mya arenaria]|uniref:ryncolin-1-like n=1 Tax=Mya arenaria TaxID=6604 RepID=UPI0022E53BF4|nr:ryncolin-1-like [Mya arenaria]